MHTLERVVYLVVKKCEHVVHVVYIVADGFSYGIDVCKVRDEEEEKFISSNGFPYDPEYAFVVADDGTAVIFVFLFPEHRGLRGYVFQVFQVSVCFEKRAGFLIDKKYSPVEGSDYDALRGA